MFRVICISRSDGAGGEEVGRLVADRLGFRYVDEELIGEAARIAQVDPALVAATEQELKRGFGQRVMKVLLTAHRGVRRSPAPGAATPGKSPTQDELRRTIRAAIEDVSKAGQAVIVAHAASMALGAKPGVLRVLVTAPNRIRSKRIAQQRQMAVTDAVTHIDSGDKARREYLRAFYEVDEELPTHYDLVVNTEVVTPEQAADLVVFLAEGAKPKPATPRWQTLVQRWTGR